MSRHMVATGGADEAGACARAVTQFLLGVNGAPGERGGAVRHRVAAAGTAQARACTRVGGFPLGAGKLSVVQRVEHATVTGVGGDFGNELRGIVGDMGNGVCDML